MNSIEGGTRAVEAVDLRLPGLLLDGLQSLCDTSNNGGLPFKNPVSTVHSEIEFDSSP